MFCTLSVHLLLLGCLLQTCFLLCDAKEYYVTPTQPSHFICPTGKPCHTLDEYAINSSWLFKGKEQVSLLFGNGIHYFTVRWSMSNIVNLTLIGLNSSSILDSPHIICRSCSIDFKIITTLKMEYLSFTSESFFDTTSVYMQEVQNFIQNHIRTWQCFYSIYSDNVLLKYELRNSVHRKLIFTMSSATGSVLIQDSMFTNDSMFYITVSRDGSSSLTVLLRNISYHGNSGNLFSSGNVFQSLHNLTIDNCYFEGNEGNPSFLGISNSKVYLKGNTTFANNIGVQGGAMYLLSSYLYLKNDSNIIFINNTVTDVGGAMYNNNLFFRFIFDFDSARKDCFYKLPHDYNGYGSNITVQFINNTAINGGDHVYGASFESNCLVNEQYSGYSYQIQQKVFHFTDKPGHDLSQVGSKQERVCLCDKKRQPQCANYSYIVQHRTLKPGEKFNLSVAVVGGDFGTVTGVVYGTLKGPSSDNYFLSNVQQRVISSPVCTTLEYSIHSSGDYLSLFIGIDGTQINDDDDIFININTSIDKYNQIHYIDDILRVTPVQINIDIQACPFGLTLNNYTYTCECDNTLTDNGIDHCSVNNGKGLVYRNETTWIGLSKTNNTTELLVSHNCPYDYCKTDNIPVDLNDSDFQCELGHVGILCGSCPPHLSLALGSSKCLNCTNDGGLAIVVGFLVAGPTLVFLIKILDFTVSWGTVNGLILYANIIWINRNIVFQSKSISSSTSFSQDYLSHSGVDNGTIGLVTERYASALTAFKVFIAWLNLDFGIENCFFQGLNAYWKTWLQFVFPIYLWIIVLTIIVLCRYSTKLTRVFGDNIVSVLATLFLMSYIKFLRTIVTVFGFAVLYSQGSPRFVWLFDGTVPYFDWPHTILFVTALLVLVILILPHTLILLCVPYLKRKSDHYLLRWINKFKPIFDVYYGPLKDKYHYWIGVTLLNRVFLALLNETSQNIPSNIILAITASISAVMSVLVTQVYKSIYLSALESFFLMNLTLLCSFLSVSSPVIGAILVCVSIGISFFTFLGIVIFHVYTKIKKCRKHNFQGDDHSVYQRLNEQSEQQVTIVTYGDRDNQIRRSDRLRETLLESLPTY